MVKFESVVDEGLKKLTGVQLVPLSKQNQVMTDLVSGKNVDILTFDKSGSEELASWKVIPDFKIIDVKLLSGIVCVEVAGGVTANVTMDYNIKAGIGAKGFWIDESTNVGLGAGLYGNLTGKVDVLSFGLLEFSGSVGLVASAFLQISDPTPGDHRLYASELVTSYEKLPKALLQHISFDYDVKLKAKASAKVAGIKVSKRGDAVDTHF